ncbi:MAG: hypothetical protein R2695_01835 [Acidimicrobiales bacterium]
MRPLPGRVVIAEYGDRFAADLAVAVLGDAGLDASVLADPAHSVAPHLVTEPGFRLVVPEDVAEHARSVLDDACRPDAEADDLDVGYYLHRFSDRPRWIRWATLSLLAAIVVPVAMAIMFQFGWMVGGLFP